MNSMSGENRSSRRGALKLTAILAILLMALFALNAPISFASVPTSASAIVNAVETSALHQSTSQTADNSVVSSVTEKADPATVTVLNLQQQQDPFSQNGGQVVPVGSGSGYIIDSAGHVVTNNHVVEGGTAFQVQYLDGTTVDAKLIGTDPYQDVAVLQLQLDAGQTVPGVVSFGDSSTVKVGDTVVAIGSPYGEYRNSVTAGIVNATDRSLDTGIGYLLPNLVQHDAAIYPGNSGGPLLNADGEVIGMNVAKAVDPQTGYTQETNIGFAIESNAIKPIVDQIIATGKMARPYLGIRTQMTIDGQDVTSVESDGPAAKAGLEAGDVITAINGQTIDQSHPFINELIFNNNPGDTVKLTVQRAGAEQTISVTLGERPAQTL